MSVCTVQDSNSEDPLGFSSEGPRGPGKLNAPHEGSLKGAGKG